MSLKNPRRCIRNVVMDIDVVEMAKASRDNLSEIIRTFLRDYYFHEIHNLEKEERDIEAAKLSLAARERSLFDMKQRLASENNEKIKDEFRKQWISEHQEYLEKFRNNKISSKGWLFLTRELRFSSRGLCQDYMLSALKSQEEKDETKESI
jgi:hypothetical protein